MNKIFSILIAASVLATPLVMTSEANAAPMRHDNHKTVVVKKSSWVRGHRISAADRRRSAAVDYRRYRLSAPPRGYQWVRVDNNFLLIGVTSGLISNILNAR
jgi:Ni/Co efflux regulator RcnB